MCGIVAVTGYKKDLPLYNTDQLKIRQVPLYCGYTGFIFQTAFETFGEQPIAGAEIRAKGNPETPVIGLLTFTYNKDNNNVLDCFHTFVPESGRGKGLAGKLVIFAFEYCIKNNCKIKPSCSYISDSFLKKEKYSKYLEYVA